MLPAYSLDEVRRTLALAFTSRYPQGTDKKVRMVGLLFAPPGTAIAKAEILPRLDDFHHRAGNNIDFFCGGYFAHDWVPDAQIVATTTDPTWGHRREWLYSPKYFNSLLSEVRVAARHWEYSGEVDLLLLNAYPESPESARLDFTGAIVLKLNQLKQDQLIESVPTLFEKIFSYAEKQSGADPTWGFSDRMGLEVGRGWFVDLVCSLLPYKTGQLWKKGRHYAVLNLAPTA